MVFKLEQIGKPEYNFIDVKIGNSVDLNKHQPFSIMLS